MPSTLAIDGGTPVRDAPLPPWPAPDEAAVDAVASVVRSGRINYWTGDEGRLFEREHAESLGREHGIALANGTLALELALRAFDVGPGDEVVVPSRTFIATASAVVAVGAVPVVCDIDPDSGCMTAETASAVLTGRTRAVIPVHLGGWPVDMPPLVQLAADHDLLVIEDCAQAQGAVRDGRPVGSPGTSASAFSFCQDKIVPAGEAGMLLLDDDEAFERAWAYKDNGKSLSRLRAERTDPWGVAFRWLVDSFGSNWRMTEMAAALGRHGLRRLPEWHAARTANASRLTRALSGITALRIPLPDPPAEHGFYRVYAFLEPDRLRPDWDRDRVLRAILAEGVPCQYGTCAEIYREAAFSAAGLGPAERLPGAARAHETCLAFYVHPTLGREDIDDVATAVAKVLEVAAS